MSTISVLFGAGADQQIGLSGGDAFAKAVVGLGCSQLTAALKDYYREKKLDSFYPGYRDTNRDESWTTRKLLEASVRKRLLSGNDSFKSKKQFDDIVKDEVDLLEKDEIEVQNQIADNPSYMGLIDGDFHTLINPSILGSGRFWRVVLFYSRAYYYLIHEMDKSVSFKELIGEYGKVQEIMNLFSEKVIHDKIENYYSVLKGIDARIISTNYTNICERVSECGNDNISYVHGKFGWFESVRDMEVYDIEKEELPNNDLLFPFIFIQSGVKPIVCRKQLREYSKMIDYLSESSVLFIVGYKINSDDNHITSILRNYLCSGKQIVYFDFNNDLGEQGVLSRMRLERTENLSVISTNSNNGVKLFKEYVEKYCK